MIRLSVNVNKVATLRNSRGGTRPSPVYAAEVCAEAGAHGITVHPRADERHITPSDVREIAKLIDPYVQKVELNIEGDPRPDLLKLVHEVRPTQCTLVPVQPGELTSQAGWPASTPRVTLSRTIRRLQDARIRVALFVDPKPSSIRWAADMGADRVELYTEPFAKAHARAYDGPFARGGPGAWERVWERYVRAANLAHSLGLGVNAGHDLDLENLREFRDLPHLAEVSIGHALISGALYHGLEPTVRRYLSVLARK